MATSRLSQSWNNNTFVSGAIGKAGNITATTGSPTIDSATRAGKTIYKFTGSGSITVGTAGTCEICVIGGGGSGGYNSGGGGGAGGYYYSTSVFLPAGTATVTVGAGGTSSVNTSANPSAIGNIIAFAGGNGQNNAVGLPGGSGGGGWGSGVSGGAAYLSQGNTGGNGLASSGGGGGGEAAREAEPASAAAAAAGGEERRRI